MLAHLHSALSYLDWVSEGALRHAELIGGRALPIPAAARRTAKIPLTRVQRSRLFAQSPARKVRP